MKKNASSKISLVTVLASLVFVSILIPVTVGYDIKMLNRELYIEGPPNSDVIKFKDANNSKDITQLLDGPMDSPWPIYCHDTRHTGRSPYGTEGNPGFEKWWVDVGNFVDGSAVIDNNNTIYFGSWDCNFYAVDLINHSVKWKDSIGGNVQSSPAIDENGIIYVGTAFGGGYLRAFYPNGTLKWKFWVGNHIRSSPAIGNDGVIYFGRDGSGSPPYSGYITALYPNGTLKWTFKTNHFVHSDVAIGLDGTIYCGSHDGNMYALYPNNGTLRWKYHTGDWVARGACIADDGTVYFGSWDGHLYAVYPNNGTLKWVSNADTCTTPVLGEDGTIYVGYEDISAVYPSNGSIKWKFNDVPGRVLASNLCVSADGTIYFGTQDDGYLIALNSDGKELWRRCIVDCYFAPIIGKDGTIYVGTRNEEWEGGGLVSGGLLHAFGKLDPNAPSEPDITGPSNGNPKTKYSYNFQSTSPISRDVYYYIDWGDQTNTGWFGPFESDKIVMYNHSWRESGVFNIRVKAKDTGELWGPWGEFEIKITKSRVKATFYSFFLQFLERFPLIMRVLSQLR